MSRVVATLAAALTILAVQSAVVGAPKREQKRAYKPADRRQQEPAGQPAQASAQDPEGIAPAADYEQELQAAKEKRDKELEDVAVQETDRRRLEKKKQEIFAQYATIVAALRDKYQAAHADDPAKVQPPPAKARPGTRAGRPKPPPAADDAAADAGKPTPRNKKGRDTAGALAEAREKLDEENTRHQAKMDQLNAQLQQAQSSDNQREVRRVQKAIEKENNSYNARKSVLERRVQDSGGSTTPAPAPAPAGP